MRTNSSGQGVNAPGVSSLNDPDPSKICNKEDDAALVDSFFLPGGLFSDESNGNHQSGTKMMESNNTLRIDPTSHAAASRSSVHLPKNPWESETTTQLANNAAGSSVMMESLGIQPLQVPTSSTNSNSVHATNYNNITGNVNHFNFSSQYRNVGEGNISGKQSIGISQFYQKPDSTFPLRNQNQEGNAQSIMTNSIKESKTVLRPPPGFQNSPTVLPSVDDTYSTDLSQQECQISANKSSDRSSMEFIASSSTSKGTKYLFASSDDHRGIITDEKVSIGAHDSCVAPALPSNRSDLYTNCPQHTFQQNPLLPSNYTEHTEPMDSKLSELNVPTGSVHSDKCDNEENNSYHVRHLKTPPPPQIPPDCSKEERIARETLVYPVSIGSEGKSCNSKDHTEDDYGDEDADADVQEEETEENSIPSFICVSICAESNSSSLSTYSDVDISESSSHASGDNHRINDDELKDEAVGYDTDQAHVSQIVFMIGNSLCSSVGNGVNHYDEQCKSPAPSVSSEGKTRKIPFIELLQYSWNFTTERLVAFLRSAVESYDKFVDNNLLAIRRSKFYGMATKRYEQFYHQMRKLSRDFKDFTNWLMDVVEVFAVLLIRLLKDSRKYYRVVAEAFMVILSFLFQLLKFGIIEALEEFRAVTSCYIVFYLMPKACVTLMDFINLPHWTPHTVTWLAIFSLCQQVERETLNDSNLSMPSFISKLVVGSSAEPATTSSNEISAESSSTKARSQQTPPSRHQQDEISRARDKQVCFLLLKTLKTILPVLYMVEGFSSEFGTIIGTRGTNRLAPAFVLSILRKSILSSPIGWVSWALQVLLASYYRSCMVLDMLILLIGFSSIRLIRFIDLQRTRGKRMHERSNK